MLKCTLLLICADIKDRFFPLMSELPNFTNRPGLHFAIFLISDIIFYTRIKQINYQILTKKNSPLLKDLTLTGVKILIINP